MAYKGWEVTVKKKKESEEDSAYTTVAKANSVSFERTSENEAIHEFGSRDPSLIKEGQREVSGSIEHMVVNREFFDGLSGDYSDKYEIKCEINNNIVEIHNVTFDSWSLDIPQDDFLVESIDFTATDITWS